MTHVTKGEIVARGLSSMIEGAIKPCFNVKGVYL